jgi:hypothetical protein
VFLLQPYWLKFDLALHMESRRMRRRRLHGKQAAPLERLWDEELTAISMGLQSVVYWRMRVLGCPASFFTILVDIQACKAALGTPNVRGSLILLELFCGVAAITRSFEQAGLSAMGYDFLKDPLYNDINGDAGFMCVVSLVLSLDPIQGFLWLATVCSSWVWMSRGSTGRSMEFPLGIPCLSTDNGNKMVARCALLMLLAIAMGSAWCLEQPMTSLMAMHPALQWLKERAGCLSNAAWFEVKTYMGAFEADTRKPSILYGNRRMVLSLARSLGHSTL